MKNITTSKFLLRHEDKQYRHQVAIKLRINKPSTQLDFPVKDSSGQNLKLTKTQYHNMTQQDFYTIETLRMAIEQSAVNLLQESKLINRENLNQELENVRTTNLINQINGYTQNQFRENDTEGFKEVLDFSATEIIDGELVEDLADIISWKAVELDQNKKEEELRKEVHSHNPTVRTVNQYKHLNWDRNDIIQAIGYLFTLRKDNGKPLINPIYKGLLKNLYGFFLRSKNSRHVNDFTSKMCREFILDIRDNGIITASLGATPIELANGEKDYYFVKNKTQIITYSTFQDKIKALNSIIANLILNKFEIEVKEKFRAETFIDNKVINIEKGINKDHHLLPSEIKTLINTKFRKKELERSKEMFLILVFCGGLRGIANFDVHIDKQSKSLDVYHSKVNKRCLVPFFDELKPILKIYNYNFPDFLSTESFSFNLKAIAKNLGWMRNIKTVNSKLNREKSDPFYFQNPLCEIIDQTFARKTFVNYSRKVYKMSDSDIITFTGHGSVDILKHYMGDTSLEDKKKIINRKKE